MKAIAPCSPGVDVERIIDLVVDNFENMRVSGYKYCRSATLYLLQCFGLIVARVAANMCHQHRNLLAKEEGKELVSVSVSLKTAVCPECGKTYVAGGETRTLMRNGVEENPYEKQQKAYENFANGTIGQVDLAA